MESQLVERARNGDREAFASLAVTVSDHLYTIAHRILRDPDLAADALQNALVIAWQSLPSLRDPDRFGAWIRRVLVHAAYAEARGRSRMSATVRTIRVDTFAEDESGSVLDRDEIERAFRHLSPEHRAVFVLHYHVGLPLVEVAETLRIPAGTARSRLHYAIRAMRAVLQSDSGPLLEEAPLA